MRLRVRPMRPQDVGPCSELVASHPEERRRYGAALEQLRPAWLKLLRAGAMKAILIEDGDGQTPWLAGCGTSVFVSDELMGRLKTNPMVWLGPELVRRAHLDDGSILPAKAIREANSREGLNLVIWSGVVRPMRPGDFSALGLELMRAFSDEHTGYRLKEFITQLSESEWARMTLNMGTLLWHSAEGCYRDGRSHSIEEFSKKPYLLGASRELASEKGEILGTWASSLFFPTSRRGSTFAPPNSGCSWPRCEA